MIEWSSISNWIGYVVMPIVLGLTKYIHGKFSSVEKEHMLFRLHVAEHYARRTDFDKIMEKLDDIRDKLDTKADRKE